MSQPSNFPPGRRKVLALALAGAAAGVVLAQPGRPWRISYLSPMPVDTDSARTEAVQAFHAGMRERSLVLGRDYTLQVLSADGDNLRYGVLVRQAVAEGADLLITPGNTAAQAAKRGAGGVPVVFVNVGNPVETGLVESLARPGGRITGRTSITQELEPKRLELLRELLPNLRRLGVLVTLPRAPVATASNASGPVNAAAGAAPSASVRGLALLQQACTALGVELVVVRAQAPAEIEPALATLASARLNAVLVFDQAMVLARRAQLVVAFEAARLPAMFQSRGWTSAGGLMSYGAAAVAEHRLLAGHAERVLRGTPAGEIPVEQATSIELLLNLKTASALGLTVPSTLLLRAEEVIQ